MIFFSRYIFVISIGFMLNDASAMLSLMWPKESPAGNLSSEFLHTLKKLFDIEIFIESGTFFGDTVAAALPIFPEIHSIELANNLYIQSKNRFLNEPSVHLYHGSSDEVLLVLLPLLKTKGKILFWLDGHYSDVNITAQGNKDTPIVEELQAIKYSGINDAIILVDDLRIFGLAKDYPTLQTLHQLIININPLYRFYIYGDVGIAFIESDIHVSPLVQALSDYKLRGDSSFLSYCIKTADSTEKKALTLIYEHLGGILFVDKLKRNRGQFTNRYHEIKRRKRELEREPDFLIQR